MAQKALLLDCNAVISHRMPASNSGCEHLYLDGARASTGRFSLLEPEHPLLDATQVMFGNVKVNSTKDKDLNITNGSTSQTLVVSVPTPNPPFSLVSGGGTFTIAPCTIAPCPNHKVAFRFAPTSNGQATQTLIIHSTDPATPTKAITLAGTGTSK